MAHTPKANGYAHPRTNPDSRLNDRRQRAQDVLDNCAKYHPHDEAGKCVNGKEA
jgi:hypothetical protein